jgi:hypothetical protein
MKLARVAFVVVLLLAVITPLNASNEDNLSGVTKVRITVEELAQRAKDIGITQDMIEAQALVAVRRDIPKITVNEAAPTILYIRINGFPTEGRACAVSLGVEVMRQVMVLGEDSSPIRKSFATVWEDGSLLTGDVSSMPQRVSDAVSLQSKSMTSLVFEQFVPALGS